MTLILNEIHLFDGFDKTMIVSAADRRLTYPKEVNVKRKPNTVRKLFEVSHLRATVSYWGNSFVRTKGKWELVSSWLPSFINKQHGTSDIGSFALNLRNELNRIMHKDHLGESPSGFHIAGYNRDGAPEFWHFANCVARDFVYVDIHPEFRKPYPDFLGRDARNFGWDGENPSSVKGKGIVVCYRNGDFLVHEAAWKKLDEVFTRLFQFPSFDRPNTTEQFKKYIEFKLKFIGSIYQNWAKEKNVGGPFDVKILENR